MCGTQKNPETIGDLVAVSLLSHSTILQRCVISIGSYPRLYNKLFAKGRECMCVFTVRALFVLLVTTRRSRGTIHHYFTLLQNFGLFNFEL